MRTVSTEQLWERLAAAGLVSGKIAPPTGQHSPWFVRAMLGFAGWIGALFLLGFVAASLQFVIRSDGVSVIIGAAVCAAAAFLFRASRGKDFAVQFGLAMSFAGQALFISGLMGLFKWESGFSYVAVAVFETALVAVVVNSIHRVVSSFAAAVSLSLALSSYGLQQSAPALITLGIAVVWLDELRWAAQGSLVRPVGYGLVLAAAFVNGALLTHGLMWLDIARGTRVFVTPLYWAGMILNSTVFIYAVLRLLLREGLGLDGRLARVAVIAALVIALSSFKAPGVITGLIIVLLGFANGNRVLTALGMMALLAYLSHYYYQLQATLLVKSVSLGATGIVLLAARFALFKLWPEKEPGGGHHA